MLHRKEQEQMSSVFMIPVWFVSGQLVDLYRLDPSVTAE